MSRKREYTGPAIVAWAVLLAGCGFDAKPHAANEQVTADTTSLVPSGAAPVDTVNVMTSRPQPVSSAQAHADTMPAATRPRAMAPRVTRTATDRVAEVVFGRIEVEMPSKGDDVRSNIYAPAEYLRAVLNGHQTYETVSNSDGLYYFERVTAGTYQLELYTAKENRLVHRATVVIPPMAKVELEDVHIALDAIRAPAYKY